MGFAGSWMAVKCGREMALARLGLQAGPALRDEVPRQLAVGELAGGWLLFMSDRMDDVFQPEFLALSELGPAVGCAIEEHVMFQEARGFEAGQEVWRVTHDAQKGVLHLEASGALPASFEAIRRRLTEEQEAEGGEDAGVDFISDIPLELAEGICGFKHDGEGWPDTFVALRRAAPQRDTPERARRPGLLQRIFGRG